MHENSHQPPMTGQFQFQSQPQARHIAEHTSEPSGQAAPPKTTNNGASFDDTQSFSGLRKLQDSAKFGKARFSFRLYKR